MDKPGHNLYCLGMKNSRIRAISGFTLVELAIVLVIIGLIVGGVLVGRDLVRQAEVSATLGQMQKYASAISAFRGKYNCLPGDCPNAVNLGLGTAGNTSGNGNGDGVIYSYRLFDTGINCCTGVQASEIYGVWQHLMNANMTDGSYTSLALAASHPTDLSGYAPQAKFGSDPTYILAGTVNPDTSTLIYFGNAFILTNFTGSARLPVACPSRFCPTYTAEDAEKIDVKMDDGFPATGSVRSTYPSVGPYITASGGCKTLTNNYDVAGNFNLATGGGELSGARPDRVECGLIVKGSF